MNHRSYFALFFLLSLAAATHAQETTWGRIQQDIFNQHCIGCHREGTSFARQSGLVLTEDVAYGNLVGTPPHNAAAAADGLLRVSSAGGSPGLSQSFLWEKVNVAEQERFNNDHPNYGQQMPLGLPYLTNGELAFIKAWISAGAPNSGIVADPALLNDTTRYQPPEFRTLAPPAQGIQFRLGPFEVRPSLVQDRELLYFEPYPTAEDLYVTRYEISMRPGSHHFIMYNYPTGRPTPAPRVYRDLYNGQGVPNQTVLDQFNELFPFYFFVGTQTPYANYHFPPGVALRLPPGSGFDLDSHSVNRSNETRVGEVYVNIFTADRSEVKHVANYANFGNDDIALPPNRETTLSKTFYFSETTHLIQMWSHAHEHMVSFNVVGVGGAHDGELLYWTNDWQHPPIMELDPPLTFKAGDGVRLITTYSNSTSNWIYFGPLSSDEMQFLFYIYYNGEITDVEDSKSAPLAFELGQNYPNPFNPTTEIRFVLPVGSMVTLKVYDTLGREDATLINEPRSAGRQQVSFDANGLPSGVYLYRLTANDFTEARKMVIMR